MDAAENPAVSAALKKIGLESASRHVFLCAGPDCCAAADGLATWERLKTRLAEQGLPILRTKAACLRICRDGPWMLVYPEGVWYGGVTPGRCERIVAEHLASGRPVDEWIAKTHPLA